MLKKKILGAKMLDTNGYVQATRFITPTNNESEAADVKRLFNQGASKPAHQIGDIYNANMVDAIIARAVSQGDSQLNDQVNAEVEARKVEDKKLGDRIAALESAKLQPKTIIEATDVVEWTDNNTVVPVNISLQDKQGHIDDDSNYTDKQLLYSYQNSKETSTQGEVSFNVSFNNPDKVTIVANGYSKYKKVNVIFPSVTKTVYAVLPSYIGYVDNVDNWNKNGQKLIKHSLNGSYNVTNGFKGNAYLVVAIPKNGAVDGIHTIVQHGMLDAIQSVSTYEKNGYTLYVCETAHNPGTYNFIINQYE